MNKATSQSVLWKKCYSDNIYWPQLFKRWITLSTGEISVSWITQLLVSLIHWVVIYLVNSTIQLLKQAGPDVLIFVRTEKNFAHEHYKATNFLYFLLTYFRNGFVHAIKIIWIFINYCTACHIWGSILSLGLLFKQPYFFCQILNVFYLRGCALEGRLPINILCFIPFMV